MKLWLDDLRRPPDSSWDWVKNIEHAQTLLQFQSVTQISLDHDLGEGEPTGYKLATWMVANQIYPAVIQIHTANPVGRLNMVALFRRNLPEGVELREIFYAGGCGDDSCGG